LKQVLFNNEYTSGILTTQGAFSQKYGYFEIRSKIPVGTGVWPAFWMLADDGGWPPEIDVLEGRGQRPGDLVMTTHWRQPPTTGRVESCGFDFAQPDAATAFHDYGVLWLKDRIIYFIDRKPVSDISVPMGFDDPMYMIVNLAMGAKNFQGVGFVDGQSPNMVEFEIDRISAYQIDAY
jgi:beta-glucanase (GH16 family)